MTSRSIQNLGLDIGELSFHLSLNGHSMLSKYKIPKEYNFKYHGYLVFEDNEIKYCDEEKSKKYKFCNNLMKLCSNDLFSYLCLINKSSKYYSKKFDIHFESYDSNNYIKCDTILSLFKIHNFYNIEEIYVKIFSILRTNNCDKFLNVDTLILTELNVVQQKYGKHITFDNEILEIDEINITTNNNIKFNNKLKIFTNQEDNLFEELIILLSFDKNLTNYINKDITIILVNNKIEIDDIDELIGNTHSLYKTKKIINNEVDQTMLSTSLSNYDYTVFDFKDKNIEKKINIWNKWFKDKKCRCCICEKYIFQKDVFNWCTYNIPDLYSRESSDNNIIVCSECKITLIQIHPVEHFIISNKHINNDKMVYFDINKNDLNVCLDIFLKCAKYFEIYKLITFEKYLCKEEYDHVMNLFNKLNMNFNLTTRMSSVIELEVFIPNLKKF